MASFASIRRASDADIPALTAIYSHHVLTGTSTFEIDPPDQGEMARRRAVIVDQKLPFLVAESPSGQVLGYCYASPYRPRPAYRFTLEDSIYVADDATGQGVGTLLLGELIGQCQLLGYREMIAVIGDSANYASIHLHQNFGFTHAGVLRNVGYKFDTWLDTIFMQRSLQNSI